MQHLLNKSGEPIDLSLFPPVDEKGTRNVFPQEIVREIPVYSFAGINDYIKRELEKNDLHNNEMYALIIKSRMISVLGDMLGNVCTTGRSGQFDRAKLLHRYIVCLARGVKNALEEIATHVEMKPDLHMSVEAMPKQPYQLGGMSNYNGQKGVCTER